MRQFQGYYRQDGSVGVRNHVLLIANCSCANGIIDRVAKLVPGAVPMIHTYGCSIPGEFERWRRILTGVCVNPNVYAVVLVGVGCETDDAYEMAERIRRLRPMPVFAQVVQEDGGGEAVIERCAAAARAYLSEAEACSRAPAPLSSLVLGTECGGADALSGVTANPVIGYAADRVAEAGGTVLLSEVAEMIGAERLLAARAASEDVAKRLLRMVELEELEVRKYLGPNAARIIARGNMEGGLTTIQEKALGCIRKGGSGPVMDVLDYGERVGSRKGLLIMRGPGYDPVSLTGLFACGAQAVLFSTGRGNPLGYPAAPCIKVCSNSATFEKMGGKGGDMDINAGEIVTAGRSIEDLGEECVAHLLEVCSGRLSAPERHGYGGAMCVFSASTPL